jgi:alcohol dehydrogenase class IV
LTCYQELWAEIAYSIRLEVPKGKKAASILAEAIRGLARSVKEPLSIKELGIPSDSFDNSMKKLVDNTMADASLIPSARLPSKKETENFFRYAYDSKSIDF